MSLFSLYVALSEMFKWLKWRIWGQIFHIFSLISAIMYVDSHYDCITQHYVLGVTFTKMMVQGIRIGFDFDHQYNSNDSALIHQVRFCLTSMPCGRYWPWWQAPLLPERLQDPGFSHGAPPSMGSVSQVMPVCPHPDAGNEERKQSMFPPFKDTVRYST